MVQRRVESVWTGDVGGDKEIFDPYKTFTENGFKIIYCVLKGFNRLVANSRYFLSKN